eukprot:g2241.t1
MPLDAALVGVEPKQSPLVTNAILTWSMNYVAGSVPSYLPIEKKYFDNTISNKPPPLHPLFVASVQEVIGAWAALYASGVTKIEVIRHPFIHYTYDAIFYDTGLSGDILSTKVHLVEVGNHRSGGHFLTSNTTRNQNGYLINKSWWGGIVLGLNTVDLKESYIEQPPLRPKPSKSNLQDKRHGVAVFSSLIESNYYDIDIPATQAHLFDGCIRDPRNVKAPSSDINTHTSLDFALKGGLDGRNLNGMCLLSFVFAYISYKLQDAVKKKKLKYKNKILDEQINIKLNKVGATFGAPVILGFIPIRVVLEIVSEMYDMETNTVTIHFNVLTNKNAKAIKDGYFIVNLHKANYGTNSKL